MTALNSNHFEAPAWSPALINREVAHHNACSDRLSGMRLLRRSDALASNRDLRAQCITVTRERGEGGESPASTPRPGAHVLNVELRATAMQVEAEGKRFHDGPAPVGFATFLAPGSAPAVRYAGHHDTLVLAVPTPRIAALLGSIDEHSLRAIVEASWTSVTDPLVERLAWLLVSAMNAGGSTTHLCLDPLAMAIATRFLDCCSSSQATRGLIKWRLKRVQDFIDEQLCEPLSLADLARCAGLSRMHFAAQFRTATGMRPHEYVVRRRIQRAQELLATTTMPLVEVALSVGFQTQAHFTTVFRKLLGDTPGRWREAQLLG